MTVQVIRREKNRPNRTTERDVRSQADGHGFVVIKFYFYLKIGLNFILVNNDLIIICQ